MKTYSATGLVYGKYWGGGEGSYPSKKLVAYQSVEALLKDATSMLDGSLDSGMGYERLLGAMLIVEEKETLEIDGKEFVHKEYETHFIGELTAQQQDFLFEQEYIG